MKSGTRLMLVALALLLAATMPLLARGNKEEPQLDVPSVPSYLSPNDDGTMDTASISFSVTLRVKSEEGYVPLYGLRIKQNDNIVRDVKKDSEKSDLGFFARLFKSYTEFTLKRDVEWDGKDDEGNVTSDGVYDVELYVVDANGNTTELDLGEFVLDNTAPTATVSVVSLYFSPNGDGNKDALVINQNGSDEDTWTGVVKSESGASIRTFTWSGAPREQAWDGRTDSGSAASDGKYNYVLTATDRAGNSAAIDTLKGVFLDTAPTPIHLTVEPAYFSPNGDGVQDTTTFTARLDITEDVVGWRGTIADRSGKVVFKIEEEATTIPETLVFDGRDQNGRAIAEGLYTVFYTVIYKNGNEPQVEESLNLDLTPPRVSLDVDNPVFSPIGRKDKVTVNLKSNETVTWRGKFLDPRGNTLVESSSDETTAMIVWDGRGPDRQPLPEGIYGFDVVFKDLAGNSTVGPKTPIEIDMTPPEVAVSLDYNTFSPNGDGIRDTITATIRPSEPVTGELSAQDSRGGKIGPVYLPRVAGSVDQGWDGMGPTGQALPDGEYTVAATFEDQAGNTTDVGPLTVTLDRRAGLITLDVPDGFSPNDNGTQDTMKVGIEAVAYDGIRVWELTIEDQRGRAVKRFEGADRLPREVVWDGKTDAGAMVAEEGNYKAKIQASYKSGTEAADSSREFLLDVSPPTVLLDVAADPFIAALGQVEGEAFVTLTVKDASPIDDWSLDVTNRKGEIVRSYAGDGNPSDQVAWKGQLQDGLTQSLDYQGNPTSYTENYSIRMKVRDIRGNEAVYNSPVPLDILVLRKDGKMFLLVPNIIFGAYQHALDSRGPAIYRRNMESLRRVANLQKRYPMFGIGLEGHALNIYRGGAKERAEEAVLGPLTARRAETVKKALVDLGVPKDKIEVNAYGGTLPLVNVTDTAIRWKNRRVEFLLTSP